MGLQPETGGEVAVQATVDGLLAAASASAGPFANFAAIASAVSELGRRHHRIQQPDLSASSAATNRPVKIKSFALAGPMSRGRRCVPPPPGMIPSRISGCPTARRRH